MLNLLSYIINIYLTLQIIAADRNIKLVSSEQGNLSEYSKSTDKCPDSYGAFGANFYSGFTCTATHPTTISSTYAVFDISSLPPHFRRDLRVEIFLVKYSSVKISFKLDSLTAVTLSPDVNSDIRLNLPCKRTSTDAGEKDSDFYINWNQNTTTLPANNAYTIFSIIDLTSTSGTSYARIKAIQYNVEQCDNSCLSCNGSLATSCTSCDTTCSLLSSGACILNQSGYVLQEGKCVSSCTSPHFNLNGKCIWIPNCSALTSGSYCTTCISGFVPVQTSNYEAQCQAYCPNDYETVNGVCLDKKRTMIGAYLLQGLFSYTFSGYEIEKMSLTLTNFASVNNFSSIFSRCGNYQILGGFFSYRNNSQISSQQYTTTYQYVRVSFKWVLIDYNSTSTPNVQISVTSSSTTYQTISLTGTSKAQLCGLGLEEYVGNFQYDYLVPSGKVVVNILNKMTAIQSNITDITDANDQRNKYQYLGIRELQIYAFNCSQSYCSTCSSQASTGCTKCIQGYYLLNSVCTACLPECLECTIGTQCTICNGGRTLNSSNQCVCQTKYYWNGTTCVACSNTSCDTCNLSNSSICLTCPSNYYLYNNSCISPCPDGYFPNTSSQTCDACITNCKTCSDSISCTICNSSLYLAGNGKSCLSSCPTGYQQNTTTYKCVACTDSNCQICQTAVDQCTKCANNYNLQGTKCQLTCDAQYYPDNYVCKLCSLRVANCLECDTNTCTKCQSSYYLYNGACQSSCPSGFYQDTSTSISKCTACSNNTCETCDSTQSTKCLTCPSSLYKNGDLCVNNCDANQFANSSKICNLCSTKFVGCYSCSQSQCFSCINSTDYLDSVNNSCGSTCPSGTFKDTITGSPVQNVCTSCNSNCYTCDINSTNCTSCSSSMYLQGSLCQSSCSDGYFPNSDRLCVLCTSKFSNCTKCTASSCTECSGVNYLVEGLNICATQCPSGYATLNAPNTCKQCTNSLCKACLPDLNSCTSCYTTSNYPYLSGVNCVAACASNEYVNSTTKECSLCSSKFTGCQSCTETTCLSCIDPNQFLEVTTNNCVVSCTSPLVPSYSPNKCLQDCYSLDNSLTQCVNCFTNSFGNVICQACDVNYVLDSNQCKGSCPDGKYPDSQNVCQQCSSLFSGCYTCNSSNCTQCQNSLYFFDPVTKQCESTCSYGANPISPQIQCQTCSDITCMACQSSDLSFCLTCDASSINKYLQNGDCVSSCSSTYYLDGTDCKLCSTKFQDCDTCNISQCSQCKSGFFLSIDKLSCFTTCPSKQYQTSVNGVQICQNCQNTRCLTCDPSNPTKCLSCDQNQSTIYLENGQCNLSCSDSTYPDSNNVCQICSSQFSFCDKCNSTQCTQCITNYYLDLVTNTCNTSCSAGQYINSTNQCQFCNQKVECSVCNPSQPSQCTLCVNTYYLSTGVCALLCPDGTYADANRVCQSCSNLSANCIKCSPGYCTECQAGNLYLDQNTKNCVTTCPNGYFNTIDNISGIKICQQCSNSLCQSCLANGSCLSCYSANNEKYLNGSQCVSSCPTGTVIDPSNTSQCVQCSTVYSNCAECDSTVCLKCQSSYYLSSGSCVVNCPSGTFKNISTGNCVSSCSYSGYYADSTSGSCLQCNSNCAECVDKSDKCTQCVTGKYLYDQLNLCYSTCPTNTYLNTTLNKCLSCSQSSCLKCENASKCLQCSDYLNIDDNMCYQTCPTGKQVYKNTCVSSCPVGYFYDQDTNTCYNCPSLCSECTSNTNCTKCITNHENNSNTSLPQICDQCVSGYQYANSQCTLIMQGGATPTLVVSNQVSKNEEKIVISAYITFDLDIQIINQNWILSLDNQEAKYYTISYSIVNKQNLSTNLSSSAQNLRIFIKIEIDSSIQTSFKTLNVNFVNAKNILDNKEFGLKQTYLSGNLPNYSEYSYPTVSTTSLITKSLAATSHLILAAATPFYLLVSFFDILQLTNYLLYLNIQYQNTLYNVIKLFDFANFEVIPNIKNDSSNAPFKFKMEKVDTFVYSNLIQSIAIWSFSFILYLVSKLILRKFKLSHNIVVEVCRNYNQNYFYQVVVGLGFLTYCDLLLSVFLQFYDTSNLTILSAVGVASSLVLLTGIIRLNILTFSSTQISINEMVQNSKIKSLYGFLYNGIELNKKKALMNLLFLFRKTIVIQQLVFNQENPINQAYICCLSVGVETTVMLILKPYRSQNEHKIHIVSRFLMVSSMIMIINLAINDSISNLSMNQQNIIQILVSVQLIIIYFMQVSYLVYKLFLILKRRYSVSMSAKLV